jgi:hypothetical protein
MKIKMITSVAGPGVYLARGTEYDLSDDRALDLLNAKFATPVAEPARQKREKATRQDLETRCP